MDFNGDLIQNIQVFDFLQGNDMRQVEVLAEFSGGYIYSLAEFFSGEDFFMVTIDPRDSAAAMVIMKSMQKKKHSV